MTSTLPRFVVVFGALVILHASGCGSGTSGTDGGGGATGQAGAAAGHSGAAGSTGDAGSTGSAGHGDAGSTGSAGHGDAGSTGSAGHGDAGHGGAGSTGTAGHGDAGHGGAGTTGTAGHDGGAGDASVSCSELANQYSAALVAARSCTVGAANQCQQAVSGSLSICFSNCQIYVQDATALNALKAQWLSAGCGNQFGIACPAIACIQPTKGNCVASDGGGGMCSTVSPLLAN